MNLTYEMCGDYLIPNLLPDPEPEGELGKFGLMRKHYLKEYKGGIYQGMVLTGKLKGHLLTIQEQAEKRFDLLVEQMAKQEGVMECNAALYSRQKKHFIFDSINTITALSFR